MYDLNKRSRKTKYVTPRHDAYIIIIGFKVDLKGFYSLQKDLNVHTVSCFQKTGLWSKQKCLSGVPDAGKQRHSLIPKNFEL